MYTEEDLTKEFDRYLSIYFKENFKDKNLYDAVYDTFRKEMFLLSKSYIGFKMLAITLAAIKEEKVSDKELSDLLDKHIKAVDLILQKILEIIEPIIYGLNVTIS